MRGFPSIVVRATVAVILATGWLLSASTVSLANGEVGPGGWGRVDLPGVTGPSRLNAVAHRGGAFVAVGTHDGLVGPAVWRSEDGAIWDKASDAARTPLVTIAALIVAFAFAFVSVGLWSYFRFRRPRLATAASG